MNQSADISTADLDRAAGLIDEIRAAARDAVAEAGISRSEAHRLVVRGGVRVSLRWFQILIAEKPGRPGKESRPQGAGGLFSWLRALVRRAWTGGRPRPVVRERQPSGEAVVRIAAVLAENAGDKTPGRKRIQTLIREYNRTMANVATFVRSELGPAKFDSASEAARVYALPASSLAPLFMEEAPRRNRKKGDWAVRGKSAVALRDFARAVLQRQVDAGQDPAQEEGGGEPSGGRGVPALLQRMMPQLAEGRPAPGHVLPPDPLPNPP